MSMGMNMSQNLGQSLEHSLVHRLALSFGEQCGDIPLYSLHKIYWLLGKKPIDVGVPLCRILKRHLIAANRTYKTESGNDWNCLTCNNLVAAIDGVDREVHETTTGPGAIPPEYAGQAEKIAAVFDEYRARHIATIKEWFEVNFDDILYNTGGKIPWPVVVRLRRNLGIWIRENSNPFHQGIEDMILDVAKEQQLVAADAEHAWQLLGGTLFK